LPGWFSTLSARGRACISRVPSIAMALTLSAAALSTPAVSHAEDATQQTDARFFAQTAYRIDRDSFWDYFTSRGGVATFGYPASRDFQFMGCTSQFFQRLIMQQCGTQGVGTLNLLDDGLLPYTKINGSTFPAVDNSLKVATPRVTDPNYASSILQFVAANAQDTFDGQPVNFLTTFNSTLTADVAGTSDPGILGLLALEVWGAPTSQPAYDPANRNFIYQRVQRGIMHYDKTCGCTQGLLLADYLKALMTGESLPADLASQAATSALLRAATASGKAPTGTVFANAFIKGAGSADQSAAMLPLPPVNPVTAGVTAQKINPPQPVPSPDFGMSMFLWGQQATTDRDLGIAASANFRWQKTLFQWRDLERDGKGIWNWSEADRIVAASKKAGIKIIARLDFQPTWARKDGAFNGPPDNYQDFYDFVSAFVSRYGPKSPIGQVDAIEVWNEVNLNREWGMGVISQQQAADYVRLLSGAYKAAHDANPQIVVITAGLSPTGVKTSEAWDDVEYMQWLFDAGMKGGVNYDVLGAHGNTQAPEVEVELNSLPAFGHPSFYFRRVEQLREVQVRNGDANRQIWLLEFGWTSDTVHPNFAWFAVSEEKKAANIVKAFQYAKANWSPWIGVMTLWTLPDPNWTVAREEYHWAIANADGTARPALTAIKNARQSGLF